jgi:hypothetical protein
MFIHLLLVEKLDNLSSSNRLCVIVAPIEESGLLTYPLDPAYSSWLFVQPRGIGSGSMLPGTNFGMFDLETASCYYARLLGETLQGMRVTDVVSAIQFIQELPEYQLSWITLSGTEEHALTALYSAIIAGIHDVDLTGLLDSFQSFSTETVHTWGHAIFVSGLGISVDIDELLAELLPGSLKIRSVLDVRKQNVLQEGKEELKHG